MRQMMIDILILLNQTAIAIWDILLAPHLCPLQVMVDFVF